MGGACFSQRGGAPPGEIPYMLRNTLTPRVFLVALGIAALLIVASLWLLSAARPAAIPQKPTTAIVTLIPAPTTTSPASTPTEVEAPTPTPNVPATFAPGTIALGAFVQVAGTGGDGLRLRAEPGLSSEVQYLGLESEVFQVEGGPEQADGYTWWYLVAPYDETRNGWAVASYLVVIRD